MKWKYHENHKIGYSARILIVWRILRIVSWPATKGFQLAPRQRRKRAAGPCELSHGADLSHVRKRRKYSGGYQGRKADHDILDARGGMEGSAAASRGHRQPAATVPARTRCGNAVCVFRSARADDTHHSRREKQPRCGGICGTGRGVGSHDKVDRAVGVGIATV